MQLCCMLLFAVAGISWRSAPHYGVPRSCCAVLQVANWQTAVRKSAKQDTGLHRVQTMLGRHRSLPGYGKGKNRLEEGRASRAAINTPIQGSAADVVAAAMVRIHFDPVFKQLGWTMLLQVHDEVPSPPWPVLHASQCCVFDARRRNAATNPAFLSNAQH